MCGNAAVSEIFTVISMHISQRQSLSETVELECKFVIYIF